MNWFTWAAQIVNFLVLVVLLRRYGPHVSGPRAARIGGRIYRRLYMQNFFSADNDAWGESTSDER